MADLQETSVYEAGIYQFETNDAVQGGPTGIDNRPTRQLANRTRWLKDNKLARDGTQTMTGPLSIDIGTGSTIASIVDHGSATGLAAVRYISDAAKRLFVGIGCSAAIHWAKGLAAIGTETNDPLVFGTNGVERARFEPEGDFVIGTQVPWNDARLAVWKANPDDGVVFELGNSSTTAQTGALTQVNQRNISSWRYGLVPGVDAFAIYGYSGGTFPEFLRLDSTGRMGLGRTPGFKLDLQLTSAAQDGMRLINSSSGASLVAYVSGATGTAFPNGVALETSTANAGPFFFSSRTGDYKWMTGTGRVVRMTLDVAGRLGIGTEEPGAWLDLGATGVNVLQAILARGASTSSFTLAVRNGSGSLANTEQARLAMEYLGGTPTGLSFIRGAGGTDGELAVLVNGTYRMRFDAGGNVGVGVNAPTEKLHVAGRILCTTPPAADDSGLAATTAWVRDLFNARSLAASGYQVLPGGLMLMWGQVAPGALSNSTEFAVTFPLAFPTACLQMIVGSTASTIAGTDNDEGLTVRSVSRTGAVIYAGWDAPVFNSTNLVRYFVIGY